VVVADLDILGFSISPTEADPPLLVNSDRVLIGSISNERLESVARRRTQIVEPPRSVD
jgi:hypothetical protein